MALFVLNFLKSRARQLSKSLLVLIIMDMVKTRKMHYCLQTLNQGDRTRRMLAH